MHCDGPCCLQPFFDHDSGVLQAANAGGVAVSGLEMSQNSMRLNWTSEEVDQKLKVRLLRPGAPDLHAS